LLRKIVAAVILVPLAIVLIAFAVANRASVTVSIDPFNATAPGASVRLPLFALIVITLIVGVVIGGAATWLRQGRWRRAVRRLEREAGELRARAEALHAARDEVGIVPREHAPPERLKLAPPTR
jgi:uncharacterized integral membrane protein